ncbi:MAG TPA: bifunctional adenosylcobinamide kinase/adenosylcobinamide-phosphate guanylyltransferase [bacterium]
MAPHLQLILGGARSGKSRYALRQGNEADFNPRLYLATASAGDEEMKSRIAQHRKERDASWQTVEEPYHLPETLRQSASHEKGLVIVDCTTLWVSNLLCGMGGKALSIPEIKLEFEKLIQVLPRLKGNIFMVSNEVGLGIVPDNPLGRNFRDLQGDLNQTLASIANQVILMAAGIPQKIK